MMESPLTARSSSKRAYLVAIGGHGDVLPILAIGSELVRRGFEVGLAAPAPYAELSKGAGLSFHPLGTNADYDRFIADARLWRPLHGITAALRFYAALTKPTYQWLAENAASGTCVVVTSTLGLGARVAQDKFGLPLVTIHVMPVWLESRHAPPIVPGIPFQAALPRGFQHWLTRGGESILIGPAILPSLNALNVELGLPPARRLRYWWHLSSRVVVMFPSWYAAPQPDWPANVVQTGFPTADLLGDAQSLSPRLEAFLSAGDPPLAFTYGSGMRHARSFFETAVAICTRMGRRGVLLAREADQIPSDLPSSMINEAYVPFSKLLPRCAALVHHGGVGTVAQAMAAGIPQLIVPVAFDHFDEAHRIERLGVGSAVSRRLYTARRASRLLGHLLTAPDVAAACANVEERMAAEDGVPAACDEIEAAWERSAHRTQGSA